jgi:hypothetical protein
MLVGGADVWKGRWVVVVLEDGSFSRAFVTPTIEAAVAELPDAAAIGVDMPIGLPSTRRCGQHSPRLPTAVPPLTAVDGECSESSISPTLVAESTDQKVTAYELRAVGAHRTFERLLLA